MVYVNTQAVVAQGVTVTIGGVDITEITDDGVPIPQTSTDDIEATNQKSGKWKEWKAGRSDGGECELKAHAVDTDPGQQALAAARASGTAQLFIVTYPSGGSQSFYGVVKTYDHIVDGELLCISCKIKVSGEPQYSVTASALTGLSVTGQTISPTFAAAKLEYNCNVVTGTTEVVVVPVQAAAGAVITVDGTVVASGGNGTVTLGAAGTLNKIHVIVQELNKAACCYIINVARATT